MVKVIRAGEAVWGKTNIALLWLNSDPFCPAVAAASRRIHPFIYTVTTGRLFKIEFMIK